MRSFFCLVHALLKFCNLIERCTGAIILRDDRLHVLIEAYAGKYFTSSKAISNTYRGDKAIPKHQQLSLFVMKFVALISGGKDSFYNILHCISNGHQLVALANLHPKDTKIDELDSFMFQTVGHDVIQFYSECLGGTPLYRRAIEGSSQNVQLEYTPTNQDEIEDLYLLLQDVITAHPDIEAVSCGAILSHYQRTRVENVCDRLSLTSLAYLWQRNQEALMQEMCNLGLDARLIKVAAVGLNEKHLNLLLQEALPTLLRLKGLYDVHVCGEGGEFESLVLDAPIFSKRLQITNKEVRSDSSDTLYLRVQVDIASKDNLLCKSPEIPPLLQENFKEIADEVEYREEEGNTVSHYEQLSAEFQTNIRVTKSSTKLFVSNVSSKLATVEEQTHEIFSQMKSILHLNDLQLFDIQHMSVLVSNMNDFAAINKVYAKYFEEKYLPPSRVCVETILPESCKLIVSCVALKTKSKRLGIHIRSRSYWAPQNIGPYSQAIVQNAGHFLTASLSGQIPLIPASMGLSDMLSRKENAILALQHLYRVMSLIDLKQFSSCVCYIVKSSDKNMIVDVWNAYLERLDTGFKTNSKLLIVQVSTLPRGALVEWSGNVFKQIDLYNDDDDDQAGATPQVSEPNIPSLLLHVSSEFGNNKIMVCSGDAISSFSEFLTQEEVKRSQITIYTSPENINSLAKTNSEAEWIPVFNVWDSLGKKKEFGAIWER